MSESSGSGEGAGFVNRLKGLVGKKIEAEQRTNNAEGILAARIDAMNQGKVPPTEQQIAALRRQIAGADVVKRESVEAAANVTALDVQHTESMRKK